MRWVTLVPTALTAIAGLKDAGQLAHYIVSKWHPVVAFVGSLVSPLAAYVDIPHYILVIMVFFAPFSIYGIYDTIWNDRKPLPYLHGIFSALVYLTMMKVVSPSEGIDVFAVFCALAFLGYSLTYLILRKRSFLKYALPLGFFIGLLAAFAFMLNEGSGKPQILLSMFVFSLPLFAPKRLIQTAVIMTTLVLLSLAYQMVAPAVGI